VSSLAFWKAVVADKSNFLERVIARLEEFGISYCVIGGVAMNAYADPVVTQDLDIVLATADLGRARELLNEFRIEEFEDSVNVYDPGSKLQVQVQKDPELGDLLERAERREVLDLVLPVAAPEDLIRFKVAAALEPTRRASKRQKDLADISRLIEMFPNPRAGLPQEVRRRLVE
jgi:hypothetical protein